MGSASAHAGVADWHTWHLTSGAELRLEAPPPAKSATTRAELLELRRLQARRTTAQRGLIAKWNREAAAVVWTRIALDQIANYRPRPPFAARTLALFETGMYDAMIAAADSRRTYGAGRPKPAFADRRIKPLIGNRGPGSSYAPEEVAMAGAAERLLAYLFPEQSPRAFAALADEATATRLWAGANYRSDVVRARALGQRVADIVISRRAQTDGSANTTLPWPAVTGEGLWSPTPPSFEPPTGGPVGTWKPWLMSSPGSLRAVIPPPSTYGSPAFMGELQRVFSVNAGLTEEQKRIATFWDDGPGTHTPAGHWFDVGIGLTKAYRTSPEQTARIFALLGAAEADASIAFFEAKYFWRSIRPVTAIWRLCDGAGRLCSEAELAVDPARAPYRGTWRSYITTPPFPSYPGGHSTFSGTAGKLLTYFFPSAGQTLNGLAQQAADSRLYGGIHFNEDNDAGLALGRAVAELAIARARTDGG